MGQMITFLEFMLIFFKTVLGREKNHTTFEKNELYSPPQKIQLKSNVTLTH